MSEETKVEELDLIEDVTELELQDVELEEDVEVENEESIAEGKKVAKESDDKDDDKDDESDEDEEEMDESVEVAEAVAPKTKAGLINAMYSEMSKMKKADLQAAYESMMGKDDEDGEDDEDLDEISQELARKALQGRQKLKNRAGLAGKTDQAKKHGDKADKTRAYLRKKNESYDFEADLNALVAADDTLSEGFQEKAATIFEAAVKSKVAGEIDRLEAEYTQHLEEETAGIRDELVEKVDGYLNYVVENWMEENRVAVENGLRTEIAESFMEALKGVFTEHYIDVPESKVDMVDDLAEQVQELEEQLTKATEDNIRLNESVSEFRRSEILAEASKDLAVTEAEKLKTLAEDVDFEDAETFAKKVATLKESYFAKKTVTESVEEAEVSMNADGEDIQVSPIMEKYLTALAKSVK